jgi:hypothetical protein
MTSKRHKVKDRSPDTYPLCILCGKGDLGPYTLQVVQAGGEEPVWTHGHCYAEVHATFATESLEEAKTLLRKGRLTLVGPSNVLNWRYGSCVVRRTVSLVKHCGQTCVDRGGNNRVPH